MKSKSKGNKIFNNFHTKIKIDSMNNGISERQFESVLGTNHKESFMINYPSRY